MRMAKTRIETPKITRVRKRTRRRMKVVLGSRGVKAVFFLTTDVFLYI